jgi:N6-L-threonylcarbamoyladenine synthase
MKAAATATHHDVVFPRAWLGDTFDFSFSGLKTAARRTIATETNGSGTSIGEAALPQDRVAELSYGFQESVIDVLVTKTLRAARAIGARSVVLGGGVAANRVLRDRLAAGAAEAGIPVVVPRPSLCTDNGAMIGAAGARRLEAGARAGLDLDARPSLPLARR